MSSAPLEIIAPVPAGCEAILARPALEFVGGLVRRFGPEVDALRRRRRERQAAIDAGEPLDFLVETRAIRDGDWTVGAIPADLLDRRVEITGPADRKMVINALNSGANVFMADFEDACAPTWENLVRGQQALYDAIRRQIDFDDPESGKRYALAEKTAVLVARPRGWHLPENHARLDGQPIPASLFDFGLYVFHNAVALVERGTGPYFYLPKMQSHTEARLWNAVFDASEDALRLPRGTIKATVLIETLPAAFEMDEILYELREHVVGLNCGRWDYIFSAIKTLRARPIVLPDRGRVTMEQPFLRAYTQLLVKTCHRRRAFAMGGMAANIPNKADPEANTAALAKVRADKLREVTDGHDGTWVAHPGLVDVAREVFDVHMPTPNQLDVLREDVVVAASDLVALPSGTPTVDGVRTNLKIGVRYLEAWLRGVGCVPLYGLMEDAATAEISRAQLWQWLHNGALLDDGGRLDADRLTSLLDEQMDVVRAEVGEAAYAQGRFEEARGLFRDMCLAPVLPDFLTLPAYDLLTRTEETP